MSADSKQAVIDALKKEGITNFDEFVSAAASKASQKDQSGNPVVMSWFVTPGYVGSH